MSSNNTSSHFTSTTTSLISNGDAILVGETLQSIGSDTVILFNLLLNTLYICTHLKDFKKGEDATGAFTKQMTSILNVVTNNKDKQIFLMMDANTQFKLDGNNIWVYSKDAKDPNKKFSVPEDIRVSAKIASVPTSNKMRGPHTAQLNKSLEPVTAIIDHILVFNSHQVVHTEAYTLGSNKLLSVVKDNQQLTTDPSSIVDHAFVISTLTNGDSYGSFNIKGGITSDQAWAEFIPQKYYDFFTNPEVVGRLDTLLLEAFKDKNMDLANIKMPNFVSKPRSPIFDINLSNDNVPHLTILEDGKKIKLVTSYQVYNLSLNENNNYFLESCLIKTTIPTEMTDWITVLLGELNSERQSFILDKGYMLLNYWYKVQTDTVPLVDGKSLGQIYYDWYYQQSTGKVPISDMIRMAKELNPNLRVISLQEMPKDDNKAKGIIEQIKFYYPSAKVFMVNSPTGNTSGAIVIF